MKYLCLAYYDPLKFAAMTPDAVRALLSQCSAHDAALRIASLHPASRIDEEAGGCVEVRPIGHLEQQ